MKVCVSADAPGSLLWMDGLAIQASRTRSFVEALRRGEIPKPIAQPGSLPAHMRVRYVSPGTIALSDETLISMLGLVPTLLHTIDSSGYRTCDSCGSAVRMYKTAANLAEEILEGHRNQGIEIQLRASPDLLTQWGETRGFRLQESGNGYCFIELDSLVAKPEAFERVRKVLDSSWSLPTGSVWCLSDDSTTAYAPSGFCMQCLRPASAISIQRLTHILRKGAADPQAPELLLNACGTTVAGLLSSSLSVLEEKLLTGKILSPALREELWALNLEGLLLGRTADRLSASALARLAVITAALDGSDDDTLVVVDVPCGLMSPSKSSSAERILQHSARRRTTVVLEQHSGEFQSSTETRTPLGTGVSLGTLRLRTPLESTWKETDLVQGSLHVIRPLETHSTEPLAADIFAALSGKGALDQHEAEYTTRHSCDAHLVDMRPITSLNRRILAQQFGLYEPLTKLYASALEARMLGLTPKDFNLSSRAKPNYLCPKCSGLGIVLESVPGFERPQARPCLICLGTRFRTPIKEIEFRGRALWQLLNSTFSEAESVLRALPRVANSLSLLKLLELDHLPVGMPACLLSFSERKLTAIGTSILSGTKSRPTVLIIEEPFAGLSERQAAGLTQLITNHELGKDVTWLLVGRDARLAKVSSSTLEV